MLAGGVKVTHTLWLTPKQENGAWGEGCGGEERVGVVGDLPGRGGQQSFTVLFKNSIERIYGAGAVRYLQNLETARQGVTSSAVAIHAQSGLARGLKGKTRCARVCPYS